MSQPLAHRSGGLLVLQPAFLGDVVLSTALMESWHRQFPEDPVRVLVRKGAEGFFEGHPFVSEVLVWDRRDWKKYVRLLTMARAVRTGAADYVVNLHRFGSMAWVSRWSGATRRTAFQGAPGSRGGRVQAFAHGLGDGHHEIERNHRHIQDAVGEFDLTQEMPKLHPQAEHMAAASAWPSGAVVLAPGSVWATKRWPPHQWTALANAASARWPNVPVILIGGKGDADRLETIAKACSSPPLVCAGELSLLETAALMASAKVAVSNDSAPLHMAGAVRCPVVGVFCSTTPSFGFGALPLAISEGWGCNVELPSKSVELECKPCGVHGLRQCPRGHFRCGENLTVEAVLKGMVGVSSLPS